MVCALCKLEYLYHNRLTTRVNYSWKFTLIQFQTFDHHFLENYLTGIHGQAKKWNGHEGNVSKMFSEWWIFVMGLETTRCDEFRRTAFPVLKKEFPSGGQTGHPDWLPNHLCIWFNTFFTRNITEFNLYFSRYLREHTNCKQGIMSYRRKTDIVKWVNMHLSIN